MTCFWSFYRRWKVIQILSNFDQLIYVTSSIKLSLKLSPTSCKMWWCLILLYIINSASLWGHKELDKWILSLPTYFYYILKYSRILSMLKSNVVIRSIFISLIYWNTLTASTRCSIDYWEWKQHSVLGWLVVTFRYHPLMTKCNSRAFHIVC